MFRYVGLFWDPADSAAAQSALRLSLRLQANSSEWQHGLHRPDLGVRVLVRTASRGTYRVLSLPDHSGVILGAVFDRDASVSAATGQFDLTAIEWLRTARNKGSEIVRRWWGSFVAIVHDATSGSFTLTRSALGVLPCHLLEHEGLCVVFSDLWDCETLGLPAFDIEWRYIDTHVFIPGAACEQTALCGVSELRPGETVELRGPSVIARAFAWNPFSFVNTSDIEDPDEAAAALRRTTRQCVDAWTGGHESILHFLSGGLDSTIVLSCLTHAPTKPRVTCVVQYSPGPNCDEREYARAAAERAGCELIECRRTSAVALDALSMLRPRSPRPSAYIGYIENSRAYADLAAEVEATALCSGIGGDAVYYQTGAIYAPADFVRTHGLRRRLLRIAYDTAALEGESVWSILRTSLAQGLLRRPWQPFGDGLLRRDLVHVDRKRDREVSRAALHPWFEGHLGAPNGKRFHAYLMSLVPFFYDPLGLPADPEPLHPLISQPLVELVLRIPTYTLMCNGWDRAVARRAFQCEIPPQVAWRRSKGGLDDHARGVFLHNLDFIREMLLDGILVARQYLDRARLERTLALSPASEVAGRAEIFEYLNLEAWLRSMVSRSTGSRSNARRAPGAR